MSFIVGPTSWWVRSKEAADYYARVCPVGTILPDGSAIYRRDVGQSWIVAPASTQISDQWISNRCPGISMGILCCICEWTNVCSRLVCCGFNPCDWFIPTCDILNTAYSCRACWDTCSTSTNYWSSTESISTDARLLPFNSNGTGTLSTGSKSTPSCVRAVRCINL